MFIVQNWVDTIVALVSGPPPSAVAVVRLSGPSSWEIAAKLWRGWPTAPESHRALYGETTTGEDALAIPFAHGRGFTSEEAVEFCLHGSRAGVAAFLEAAQAAGARMATPGEFSRRAFMNGRLDLSQAEGIQQLIEAETSAQWQVAARLRGGEVATQIERWREQVMGVLARLEAQVDFSEELGELDREPLLATLESVRIEMGRDGSVLDRVREGAVVAILGEPNAGKSSLLNRISGFERAIVTPIPGTTRDTIELTVDLEGYRVTFVDTAGLRETPDPIEQEGVRRSLRVAEAADLRIVLIDPSAQVTSPIEAQMTGHGMTLVVRNKADLYPGPEAISCLTGEGVPALLQRIKGLLFPDDALSAPPFVPRHRELLSQALQALERAAETIADNAVPDDLATVFLREALAQLGAITGTEARSDMVDEIFSRFCLGK